MTHEELAYAVAEVLTDAATQRERAEFYFDYHFDYYRDEASEEELMQHARDLGLDFDIDSEDS